MEKSYIAFVEFNQSVLEVMIRAVVFRLFQKTVILPPNLVGFRLTYTKL